MTKVRIQAVEQLPAGADGSQGREIVILEIDLREFTQGAQFGEASDAITYAQRVVKQAARLK